MGNVGIRAPRNGSAITVIELDTSWLSACLDLDQRCLRGLWNEEQWRRELEEPQRLCLGLIEGERLLTGIRLLSLVNCFNVFYHVLFL